MIEKEQNRSVKNLDKLLIISIFIAYSTNVKIMTTSNYSSIKLLIISALKCDSFSTLKRTRKHFILNVLLCFLSIKGKINFLQLSRFSSFCEQFFRIHFENRFNFKCFNLSLVSTLEIKESIVAFDPSYIPKSGKQTFGLGRYWSGCSKQAKWGLDICGFALVDVFRNTAFHLNAIQTSLKEGMSLLDYYCGIIKENYLYFKECSSYMVADAYFSKKKVVDTILSTGLHFISRMRDDANLNYIYKGEPSNKRGAPKKFDGKVNPKKLNMNHFTECFSNSEITIYSAWVYSIAFKRNINLAVAVFYKDGREICRKLYFSTDMNMKGKDIVRFYRSRFQIECLYRDAKQHCGLTSSQARSENKLDLHFNAALTAVNLAKIDWINSKRNDESSFSMADYKIMFYNHLLLNQFIRRFAINPNTKKNKLIIQELIQWGKIAE